MKDSDYKDLPNDVMEIQMGPSHPAMHGIIKLNTKVSGETILAMDVEIGYLHRAFEKMCEHRNWNQNIVFTDRLNYVSSPLNNCAYVSAVEALCGIEITERAKWMRTIVSELARITDHLTCVGATVMELGGFTGYMYLIKAREELMMIFDRICGSRLTTSLSRVGGMMFDFYDGWQKDIERTFAYSRDHLEQAHIMLTRNRIFYDRLRGTGLVTKDKALDMGFTGPLLRSTGCDYDVRKYNPHWAYDEVEFDVAVGERGDNFDRYLIRLEEIEQSMRIVEQCIEKIPDGDVDVDDHRIALIPKSETYNHIEGLIHHFEVVMHGPAVPKGEAYFATESPNGEHGYFVVSEGEGTLPYRVRARPTCLPFTMFFPEMVIGSQIADIIPSFGSINMIGGELER